MTGALLQNRNHRAIRIRGLAIAFGFLAVLSSQSRAQNIDLPSAVTAAEGVAEQALLARATRPDAPYRIQVDIGGYSTDNALFLNQNPVEDTYAQYLLAFGGTVPLKGESLFFNVGVVQAAYQFDTFGPALNYEYMKATPGFFYRLEKADSPWLSFWEGCLFYALYDYNRYSNDTLLQELYTSHSLSFGFLKSLPIVENQDLVFGIDLEPSLAGNLANNRRHRGWFLLAYDVDWSPAVTTRLAYKAAYADFTDAARDDLNHALLLNLDCSLHRRAWGDLQCEFYTTGTLNYVVNESTQLTRDYKFFSAGASVGVRATF